jgi:hypothetical protein
MNLQAKLQELKSMHDQGLITAEVYATQQQSMLSQGLGAIAAAETSVPDEPSAPRSAGTSSWKWLVLVVVLVMGGVWFASNFGSRETKDAVNQLASQTGIGAQVIPWSDRAETAARKLIEINEATIAKAVLAITHATGTDPTLTKTSIAKLDERVIVELNVAWKGGIFGTPYQTTVTWEIAKANHVAARVLSDSALTEVSQSNKEALDNYFRTKVYPAFYADISGTAR